MKTFILIHNYFLEDHYPAQSVTPFQCSLSHEDLMKEIDTKKVELVVLRRIHDEKMQTFYARRRAVINSEEYCRIHAEILTLNKTRNRKLNSTQKKDRNELFHTEIKALTARLDTCRDTCRDILRKLEEATLDGLILDAPENKFIIGGVEIRFDYTSDDQDEIQVLTVEEWLAKSIDNQICISYH